MSVELVRDRERAVEALMESIRERLRSDPKGFIENLNGYDLVALNKGAETIGAVMFRKNEVHIAIRPSCRKRWYSKRLREAVLGPLVSSYGCAVTSVMKDNQAGIDFVTRLGFRPAGQSIDAVHFRLERL